MGSFVCQLDSKHQRRRLAGAVWAEVGGPRVQIIPKCKGKSSPNRSKQRTSRRIQQLGAGQSDFVLRMAPPRESLTHPGDPDTSALATPPLLALLSGAGAGLWIQSSIGVFLPRRGPDLELRWIP